MPTPTPDGTPDGAAAPAGADAVPSPSAKGSATRLLAIVVPLLAVAVAVVWLYSGAGSEPAAPKSLAELPRVDGRLSVVEPGRLVLTAFEPVDGRTELEFEIPAKYAYKFDQAHLRSHSADGTPVRIYYLTSGDRLLAAHQTDAPAAPSG